MKNVLLLFLFFFYAESLNAQIGRDTFSIELSPIGASYSRVIFSPQIKSTYKFGKWFEVTARHNESFRLYKYEGSKPNPYKRNSFSTGEFSTVLLRDGFMSTARLDYQTHKFTAYEFRIDAGVLFSRFSTPYREFYTYDSIVTGEEQTISSINTFSALAGVTYNLYIFKGGRIKCGDHAKWIRQYNLSFGLLHGLDYNLEAYTIIPGKNPTTKAPEKYGFRKDGYYSRFNFQQRLTTKLYCGLDLFYYQTPYVQYYQDFSPYYEPRGEESQLLHKIYASFFIGYHF